MSKKNWSKQDLESFKESIMQKKKKALDDLVDMKERTDNLIDQSSANSIYSSHMADASGDHVELEKAYYMIARTKKYINYLDKALNMIDDKTFGICIACNQLIPKDRLKEVPHTTKCVDCKENR